jgi:hypothetical protein
MGKLIHNFAQIIRPKLTKIFLSRQFKVVEFKSSHKCNLTL